MSGRSGVIVRIGLPAALERLRRKHDPAAGEGVPAHVTILYPFLREEALDASVRRRLAEIAATVPPFVVRFQRVGRFPGVLWLAPEPEAPFQALTAGVVRAWPDHPPYGGDHDEVVPHLTIGNEAGVGLDHVEQLVRSCPPFEADARALEVIVERSGHWHRRWRIPLGEGRRSG